MRFTIEVEGETQLDREFNRVKETIDDLTPVWKEVQQEFFDIEFEQFSSEGAKGASGKWKPLSPKYEEIKLKKYGTIALIGGILYATGAMRESLTRHAKDTIEEFGKQEAAFGTSLPYATYHQTGGGRLPRRKVIDLSDEQKRRVQKRIQKELLKLVKGRTTLIVDESNYTEVG